MSFIGNPVAAPSDSLSFSAILWTCDAVGLRRRRQCCSSLQGHYNCVITTIYRMTYYAQHHMSHLNRQFITKRIRGASLVTLITGRTNQRIDSTDTTTPESLPIPFAKRLAFPQRPPRVARLRSAFRLPRRNRRPPSPRCCPGPTVPWTALLPLRFPVIVKVSKRPTEKVDRSGPSKSVRRDEDTSRKIRVSWQASK